MPDVPGSSSAFDGVGDDYEAQLQRGVVLSGEDSSYFARERLVWLKRRLDETGRPVTDALDFGCGRGSATRLAKDILGAISVVGVDASRVLLDIANRHFAADDVRFTHRDDFAPAGQFDLVFCNGVFHHIAPADRPAALQTIWHSLRPGGTFALFENNPWNPGTRWVMSRIPFDRDAILLSPRGARRLLRGADLDPVDTDFLFFFPRFARWFRRSERWLAGVPLGAQYLVLCRRPV